MFSPLGGSEPLLVSDPRSAETRPLQNPEETVALAMAFLASVRTHNTKNVDRWHDHSKPGAAGDNRRLLLDREARTSGQSSRSAATTPRITPSLARRAVRASSGSAASVSCPSR